LGRTHLYCVGLPLISLSMHIQIVYQIVHLYDSVVLDIAFWH
jgi:hypothetical protein